jgi:hypothetical protein
VSYGHDETEEHQGGVPLLKEGEQEGGREGGSACFVIGHVYARVVLGRF